MQYLHFVIAGLILGVESRGLGSSSLERELEELENQGSTLNWMDEVQGTFTETETEVSPVYSTPFTPSDSEFAKQDSILPQDLRASLISQAQKLLTGLSAGKNSLNEIDFLAFDSQTQSIEKNHSPESKTLDTLQTFQNLNSLKDLFDSVQELDVFYQDFQDDARHVKSRYENSSQQFPPIQNDSRGFGLDSELRAINEEVKNFEAENRENDAKELDTMLADLQSQINRMRKYSERLCRKHHSAVKASGI